VEGGEGFGWGAEGLGGWGAGGVVRQGHVRSGVELDFRKSVSKQVNIIYLKYVS
jgi:hypothetical protein